MKTEIYNVKGEKTKKLELSEEFFSVEWNPNLVHEAVVAQMANSRQGSAHTKDRGDVSGGGKKPWRQKGTGRARHGSNRSPIWRGGGVTFGPRNDKDYGKKINKKAKKKALFSAVSKKLTEGEVKIIDSSVFKSKKTKEVELFLKNFFKEDKISVLFVTTSKNKDFYLAARNIFGVSAISPLSLNVVDVLKYKNIFIDKDAVPEIVGHYGKKPAKTE